MKTYTWSQKHYHIWIQWYSKIPRAKWEGLKNAKCMLSSRDCICSSFYLAIHLLNTSLKRKTDNIFIILRLITTAERARAVGMLQQYVSSITLLICTGHRSLNASVTVYLAPHWTPCPQEVKITRAGGKISRDSLPLPRGASQLQCWGASCPEGKINWDTAVRNARQP